MSDKVERVRQLVYRGAVSPSPRTPLDGIPFANCSVRQHPFIPNVDVLLLQSVDLVVSGDEPQQFRDDATQEHFFRGYEWETVLQVEFHTRAERG